MRILSESRVRVVPLHQVPATLQGAGTEPAVAITFDDGFQNLYRNALPVLSRYGFPATVFLVTDYCERDNGWPSQPSNIERRPLLHWSEIKAMSASGIAFGSHTRTHADLTKVPDHIAEEEMTTSKKSIEDAIGQAVETFAYPYGACNERVRHLAGRHFALACSTILGFAVPINGYFGLERIEMYYLRRPYLFRRLFSPEMRRYLGARRVIRNLRGWVDWTC